MRHPNPDQRGRNNSPLHSGLAAWLPVLAAMAIMLTGCLSTFLVLQLDEFRPKIGDIVVFKPGLQDPDMWQMTIPAQMVSSKGAPAGRCVLDPDVIAKKGGSLIVEGLQLKPSLEYMVHWAGSRSTHGRENCGTNTELTVSRTNLQRLANAAGGFGVGNKGITE
jgi:hypothetical protein